MPSNAVALPVAARCTGVEMVIPRIRLVCFARGEESGAPFPFMPVGEATCDDPTSSFPRTWEDAR